jgi:hypothetical protein
VLPWEELALEAAAAEAPPVDEAALELAVEAEEGEHELSALGEDDDDDLIEEDDEERRRTTRTTTKMRTTKTRTRTKRTTTRKRKRS